MKRIIHILILLLIALSFAACTEKMDIELDESYTRVVAEGMITNEPGPHLIRLTTTAPYFSNQPVPVISGAKVYLVFDGDSLLLPETSPGNYTTPGNFAGVVGTTYRLSIHLQEAIGGSDYYYAISTLPRGMKPDSARVNFKEGLRNDFWEILLYGQEPLGEDAYMIRYFQNGVLETDSLIEWNTFDDRFFDGLYLNGVTVAFATQRRGQQINPGDTIVLEVYGIERWFSDYLAFMQRELFPQTPLFSPSPSNVKGNISGTALGYFEAATVKRVATIYRP
ncbi:MAG: hypothetical protein PWR20_1342 [Bacteroidales bacterium]|jgi:hypothetical protein|nr:hypothetical protein [Bacteroidales bacterium]MDN5329300.1 hypothetical protein [Bacteroidales bacterium]